MTSAHLERPKRTVAEAEREIERARAQQALGHLKDAGRRPLEPVARFVPDLTELNRGAPRKPVRRGWPLDEFDRPLVPRRRPSLRELMRRVRRARRRAEEGVLVGAEVLVTAIIWAGRAILYSALVGVVGLALVAMVSR